MISYIDVTLIIIRKQITNLSPLLPNELFYKYTSDKVQSLKHLQFQ